MKAKLISVAIAFSLAGVSAVSHAAQINFRGEITAQSCDVDAGEDVQFILPTFGVSDVQVVGQHNGTTTVSVPVSCGDSDTSGIVTMSLMPMVGTTEGKVLKNTSGGGNAAKGVGIVVLDDSNNPLDFENGSAELNAPLNNGAARVKVSATYAKDGSGEDVEPGSVRAVLPFVLTYE